MTSSIMFLIIAIVVCVLLAFLFYKGNVGTPFFILLLIAIAFVSFVIYGLSTDTDGTAGVYIKKEVDFNG